jgi:hypothetical protein
MILKYLILHTHTQSPVIQLTTPSAKSSTIPANLPFTKADLASHFLRMCLLIWQDHFNLHKKSMTPVDMRLLLMSLKDVERVCKQEKSTAPSNKKSYNKSEKGTKRLGTESTARVPKKVCFEKHCNFCKKHGDTCAAHNAKDCHKYEKDRSKKADFCAAKKGGKKPNLIKNSFMQMIEKLEKLEKAIKKQAAKSKKCCRENSNSNSE